MGNAMGHSLGITGNPIENPMGNARNSNGNTLGIQGECHGNQLRIQVESNGEPKEIHRETQGNPLGIQWGPKEPNGSWTDWTPDDHLLAERTCSSTSTSCLDRVYFFLE